MHAAFRFLGYTNLYPLAFYTGKLSFFLSTCVRFLVDIHHCVFRVCVCVYLGMRLFVFFVYF